MSLAEEPVKVSAEQLGVKEGTPVNYIIPSQSADGYRAEHDGQLELDLGNLTAWDPGHVDANELRADPDGTCLRLATAMTQSLVAAIFRLPSEAATVGRLALLPAPTTPLPRAKPLPVPRPPTKWEKFAAQKGIVKKKRSKLTFDEGEQAWKRRYGYQKANDEAGMPIIEASAADEVGSDPFTEMRQAKRERTKKNEKQQMGNLKVALKQSGPRSLPGTVRLAASLPEHGKGRPSKRKDMEEDIRLASRAAGTATASMGKFDTRAVGEKEGERTPAGKRQKLAPVVDKAGTERVSQATLVDKILRERSDDVIDVNRAVGKMEAAKRAERHEQKKAEFTARLADGTDVQRGRKGRRGAPAMGGKGRRTGGAAAAAGGKRGGRGGGRGGRGSGRGRR